MEFREHFFPASLPKQKISVVSPSNFELQRVKHLKICTLPSLWALLEYLCLSLNFTTPPPIIIAPKRFMQEKSATFHVHIEKAELCAICASKYCIFSSFSVFFSSLFSLFRKERIEFPSSKCFSNGMRSLNVNVCVRKWCLFCSVLLVPHLFCWLLHTYQMASLAMAFSPFTRENANANSCATCMWIAFNFVLSSRDRFSFNAGHHNTHAHTAIREVLLLSKLEKKKTGKYIHTFQSEKEAARIYYGCVCSASNKSCIFPSTWNKDENELGLTEMKRILQVTHTHTHTPSGWFRWVHVMGIFDEEDIKLNREWVRKKMQLHDNGK